jgi:hypothetical protein
MEALNPPRDVGARRRDDIAHTRRDELRSTRSGSRGIARGVNGDLRLPRAHVHASRLAHSTRGRNSATGTIQSTRGSRPAVSRVEGVAPEVGEDGRHSSVGAVVEVEFGEDVPDVFADGRLADG